MPSIESSLGLPLPALYGLLPGTWLENAGPTASYDFAILLFSVSAPSRTFP